MVRMTLAPIPPWRAVEIRSMRVLSVLAGDLPVASCFARRVLMRRTTNHALGASLPVRDMPKGWKDTRASGSVSMDVQNSAYLGRKIVKDL
jgi:hypothetical protein